MTGFFPPAARAESGTSIVATRRETTSFLI